MFRSTMLLPLLMIGLVSADMTPLLVRRQTVPVPCSADGRKTCGSGCIQSTWTCCPSGAGGCPPTHYCAVGSNGLYGCCPVGEDCEGNGGSRTTGGGLIVSVTTSTIVDEVTSTSIDEFTSTIVEDTTSTSTSTSTSTLTSTSTSDDIPPSPPPSNPTSPPISSTPSSVPPPVLSSSRTPTPSSNLTTSNPTTTSPTEFTGAASGLAQGTSIWLLALALPIIAL